MPKTMALSLACVIGMAAPAMAAPFVAVDGNNQYVAMLDEGSLVRSTGAVDGESLMVMFGRPALLARFHFDCTGRTWRQTSNRAVGDDAGLSAPRLVNDPAAAVKPGTLGVSLLERACFGRQINSAGGWSRASLADALAAARAVLTRANSQP